MRAGFNAQFLGILAALLTFVLVLHNHNGFIDDSPARNNVFDRRQAAAAPAPVAAASTSPDSTSPQAATTTTPAASPTSQQATTPTTSPVAAAQKTSTQANAQPAATPTNAAAKTTAAASPVTSAIVTTNAGGQVVTSVVVVSDTQTSTTPAPTQTSSSDSSGGGGGGGISTSTVIGLSVAGGVAVLCVIGFFVWKLTRKRGEFDSNEEIKWPELNAHDDNIVPLPTNRMGGAGFDTEHGRRSSLGYAPSTAATSTAELQPDPYAVPPLPHLDPNQPYHDDPTGRYYDPYRGPIPQTFDHGEAIPMTQLAAHRSPGPGDFGARASPAAPAPYGADFGGQASPGPRAPYAGGRKSPGPQAAYGGGNVYGPR